MAKKLLLCLGAICTLFTSALLAQNAPITRGSLSEEQRLMDSHLDSAERELREAKTDFGLRLVNTAWMRVINAGNELDQAKRHMNGHPQRIAQLRGFGVLNSTRDEYRQRYEVRERRHASINREVLTMQVDVGGALGIDLNYVRSVLHVLEVLCESTNDPKWCDSLRRMRSLMASGDAAGAFALAKQAGSDASLEGAAIATSDDIGEQLETILKGPAIDKSKPDFGDDNTRLLRERYQELRDQLSPPPAVDLKQYSQLLTALAAAKKRCHETKDPQLCQQVDRIIALINEGRMDEAQRAMDELGRSSAWGVGTGGGVVTGGGDVTPRQTAIPPSWVPSNGGFRDSETGEVYYFPNGFDQPGVIAGYAGEHGTRISSERKVLLAMRAIASSPGEFEPEMRNLEEREWEFQTQVVDEMEGPDGLELVIRLVEASGRTSGYQVQEMKVTNATGQVLVSSSSGEVRFPVARAAGRAVIQIRGTTDWGSPFAFSVEMAL